MAGHCEQCDWLRKDGAYTRLNRDQILESVEGSLERLGTDYIDVLHIGDWPERCVPDKTTVRIREYVAPYARRDI